MAEGVHWVDEHRKVPKVTYITGCGLHAINCDDLCGGESWHGGEMYRWCHCPHKRRDCPHAVEYSRGWRMMYCKLVEVSADGYDYENSVEWLLDDAEGRRLDAWEEYVRRHHLYRTEAGWAGLGVSDCHYIDYDEDAGKFRPRAGVIRTCMMCNSCVFLKRSSEERPEHRVMVDMTLEVGVDRGHIGGWEWHTSTHALEVAPQKGRWWPLSMCERLARNVGEDTLRLLCLHHRVRGLLCWDGYAVGSIIDCFTEAPPRIREEFLEGQGWLDCKVSFTWGKPYIVKKGARGAPDMVAMRKAAAAAKKAHMAELNENKILRLMEDLRPEVVEAHKGRHELEGYDWEAGKARKLGRLKERFPELYWAAKERFDKKHAEKPEQLTLF